MTKITSTVPSHGLTWGAVAVILLPLTVFVALAELYSPPAVTTFVAPVETTESIPALPALPALTKRIKGTAFACQKYEDFAKWRNLVLEDTLASKKFFKQHYVDGSCVTIQEGTLVHIDEVNMFSYPCVRIAGEVNCLYTSRKFLND